MARRYIGDAVITIAYHDAGDYRGSVRAGGYTWAFRDLHAAPIGFGPGIAYDSAKAYDEMAASAVGFGSSPNEGDPSREVADAISDATGWAMNDRGQYEVRRSPTGAATITSEAANMRRRSRKNPLPGGDVGVLVGLGVLVAGVVGYAVYQATQASQQQTAAAGGGGGAVTSPPQSYTLGPGGSTTPLASNVTTAPTDNTPTDYEAGPGANAPLMPTGT